jgi:hypothetical protein
MTQPLLPRTAELGATATHGDAGAPAPKPPPLLAVGSYYLTAADADAELLDDSDGEGAPAAGAGAGSVPRARGPAADASRLRTLRNRWWLAVTLTNLPALRRLRRRELVAKLSPEERAAQNDNAPAGAAHGDEAA